MDLETNPPDRTERIPVMPNTAYRLASFAERLLGGPLPVALRAWDGTRVGPAQAPAVVLRNRRALRRLLYAPASLGLTFPAIWTSKATSRTASGGSGSSPAWGSSSG